MRRLGQARGVKAMSLYNHIANKDAILDGLLARVLTQVALPAPNGNWEEELRRCSVSLHEALRQHPWARSRRFSLRRCASGQKRTAARARRRRGYGAFMGPSGRNRWHVPTDVSANDLGGWANWSGSDA
jgi:AcrR family transcriptional regulator